jgi:RNA polymerase sigma-70 factor, ECF subfamily
VSTIPTGATPPEQRLLMAARGGDDAAFARLVEPYRAELHAHCYRMLASIHDAEDALQETLVRAWRGLPRFEGRSSLRNWLYRIATNVCLNLSERRPKRALPLDLVPQAAAGEAPGRFLAESVWMGPYPDGDPSLPSELVTPEARYEQRESLELAFVAALQHLSPQNRAVLILREVLGFSAAETAESLEISTASVNSALQRARRDVEGRVPAQSQQVTLRELGDERVRELVGRYMQAMEQGDVSAVLGLLVEDAAWSMPPMATWYSGTEAVTRFLAEHCLTQRWRHVPFHANGQAAVGCYLWEPERGVFVATVMDVLTLRGNRIAEITAFFDLPAMRGAGLPDELAP